MKNYDDAHKEKSGYSIEKTYRKQATPIQKKLDKLRKEYESLLADTEKAMNKAQNAHDKKMRAHNERFEALLNSNEASFIMEKEAIDQSIGDTKAQHKEALKKIKYKNSDKKKSIKADLQAMEKEKQKTAKDIERTHKKRIENYEKRLELSKQNHNDNTRQTQNSLKDALEKLDADYKTHKATIDDLNATLETRFNKLHADLSETQSTLEASIKKSDNALQHTLNTYRKEVNEQIRAFSKELYEYKSAIHSPFLNIDASASDLWKQFESYKNTFVSSVNMDMKFEQARLKDLLARTSEEESPEEFKTIQKQMELQQLRKDALIEHIKSFEDAVKKTTETLKSLSSDTLRFLENIFKNFDETVHYLHANLKAKFDVFQSGSSDLRDTLTKEFAKGELSPFLNEAKTALNDTLSLFSKYATDKIEAIKDTTVALLPLYQEADDIRFFLDTEEAHKKIRENREKISVEQQDASLNIDMKQAEKKHEVELMNLDERYSTKDALLKHTLELKSLEQKKAFLDLDQNAEKSTVQVEKEMEKAALEHDLEAAKAKIEKAHVEHAKTLEKAIENQKMALRSLDLQKERDLALIGVNAEKTRRLKTLSLKLDRNKQALERQKKTIREEKTALEKQYDIAIEDASMAYREKETSLQDAFEDAKNQHEEKLTFIDQALQRETQKAQARIDQTQALLNTRKQIVNSNYTQHLEWLSTHHDALENEDASLKSLLIILSTPKKNSLIQTLDTFIDTLKETQNVVLDQFEEGLKRQGVSKRHKKSQLNKLKNTLEKSFSALKAKKDRTAKTYEDSVDTLLKKIRSQKTLSLSGLKAQLLPLNESTQKALKALHDAVLRSMNESFAALKQDDEDLIEKARSSAKKAKAEENIRYENAKAPLNKKLDALKQDKDSEVTALKEKLNEALTAIDQDYEASLKPLEEAYENDLEAYRALENDTEEKYAALKETYQNRLNHLDEELNTHLETIDTQSDEKIKSVNSRLEDAKNIHAFHVENEETKKADIEKTLEKDSANLETAHESLKADIEKQLTQSREAYEKEKASLEEKLKATLEGYETKMLSSSNELDQRIEKVNREIADQIRIKKARKTTLEATIEEKLTELQTTLDSLNKTLQRDTQTLLETLFETDSEPLDTTDLFNQQDTLVSSYIESIKNDVQNL